MCKRTGCHISGVILNMATIDINNVGSISQALFAKGNPDYDEVIASKWQAAQVSSISITNFGGRILMGKYSTQSV